MFTTDYTSYTFSNYKLVFVDDLATDVLDTASLSICSNRLLFPQLIGALNEIVASGLSDTIHPDQYEGCYWPKLIEDSDHLSMHAWGLAFDINVPTNQRLTQGNQDPRMVAVFKKWGFRWGGDWKDTPDPMHFELASLLSH